jgi:hypothetical protein
MNNTYMRNITKELVLVIIRRFMKICTVIDLWKLYTFCCWNCIGWWLNETYITYTNIFIVQIYLCPEKWTENYMCNSIRYFTKDYHWRCCYLFKRTMFRAASEGNKEHIIHGWKRSYFLVLRKLEWYQSGTWTFVRLWTCLQISYATS